MVSRKLGWLGLGLALGLGSVGCFHQEQAPETWASLPVLVSSADAATITVRVDDHFSLTGRESEEVAERASLKKRLPDALRDKLEGAGFKVVAATDPADLILTVQSSDLEWTGHFWEVRGHVGVSLSRPSPAPPPSADGTPPPESNTNPYLVTRVIAGFDHLDVPNTADVIASSAADQLTRSPELAQYLKDKRAKDGPVAAPPPPNPPPAAPAPPSPPRAAPAPGM